MQKVNWPLNEGILFNQIFNAETATEAEWLENRKRGIGGSDMAAVLGYSKYSSAIDVWLDKTGKSKPSDGNEYTYWGHVLEPVVAEEFAKRTGKTIVDYPYTLQSIEHPFLIANIDRAIEGENAGLEIKTTAFYREEQWGGDNVPDAYYIQCQHYMAVTGAEGWYIACLTGDKKFIHKYIKRNEDLIDAMIEQGKEFWDMVENNVMPAVDNSTNSKQALQDYYNKPTKEAIELPSTATTTIQMYYQAKADEADAKARKQLYENELCQLLGNAERGTVDGYTVSWTPQKGRTSYDVKGLVEELGISPEILAKYTKVGAPSRRFGLKGGLQ